MTLILKTKTMRNNRGRNLFSSNPNGSKLAYARNLALKKAEAKGVKSKALFYLESAMSINAVLLIETKLNLNN